MKWGLLLLVLLLGFFWHRVVIAPSPRAPDSLPLAEPAPQKTTLVAVGDILLSRNVGLKIAQANHPHLPFEKVSKLLSSADITFGNLECPLSDSNIPIREGLVFRCLTKYVPGLADAGFDVMSTANNHAFDQGQDSIGFTVDHLKSQGILPVGTGNNFAETHAGQFISPPPKGKEEIKEGVRFGFLAYSYSARNDGGQSTHPQIATMHDLEILKSDILNLKSRANVIFVSMHAGTEYVRTPTKSQIDFAHAAIDAGADIVIGHHPHWIQDIEIYKSKPIFYSLGNFIFDQMWSEETREGLMVELAFEEHELKSAKLIPIIIDNFCCPQLATEEEKQKILKKINLGSDTMKW